MTHNVVRVTLQRMTSTSRERFPAKIRHRRALRRATACTALSGVIIQGLGHVGRYERVCFDATDARPAVRYHYHPITVAAGCKNISGKRDGGARARRTLRTFSCADRVTSPRSHSVVCWRYSARADRRPSSCGTCRRPGALIKRGLAYSHTWMIIPVSFRSLTRSKTMKRSSQRTSLSNGTVELNVANRRQLITRFSPERHRRGGGNWEPKSPRANLLIDVIRCVAIDLRIH